MQRFLVSQVQPDYPAEAAQRHIGGTVVLHIIIDREGNVSNIEPESGDPLLIKAAVDAVKQWKYKPYLLAHTPVEVETDGDRQLHFRGQSIRRRRFHFGVSPASPRVSRRFAPN